MNSHRPQILYMNSDELSCHSIDGEFFMVVLWGLAGSAIGFVSGFVTRKFLPKVLSGASPLGAVLMGLKLLWHAGALALVALIDRDGILWAAGGDALTLIGFGVFAMKALRRD